jgi:hypothetical protein
MTIGNTPHTTFTFHRTCTGCGNILRIVIPRSQGGAAFLPEMHRACVPTRPAHPDPGHRRFYTRRN